MLDLARFRLLVALSAKLTLRGYLNNKPALLGLVALLALAVPTALKLAFRLPQYPLSLIFLGIFGLLVAAPLAFASVLPDAGDPARLLHYPVTPRTLAAALATGAFLDPVGLLTLAPILVALPVHFGATVLVPTLLLVVTALLLGQVVLFLGGALARSRRFRESASFLLPFAAAGLLLLAVRAPAKAATTSFPSTAPSVALTFTPPELAAQRSFVGCIGLALWASGAFFGAGKLVEARAGTESERNNGGRVGISLLKKLARGAVLALATKELTYFLREPRLRGALSRSSAVMVAVGVLTLYPTNAPRVLWDSIIGTGVVFYLLFWLLERSCNQWGTESVAGRLLWSFPGERWRWVLGKNLALFPLIGGCVAFALIEYAVIAHPPPRAVLGYFLTGSLWVFGILALGNVVSLFLPFPILGKAAHSSPGQDFTTGILYIAIAVAAAYLTAVPWLAPLLWAASVPLAGRLLARREPQVIAALE